jgi:tetratricopeptide (TPR) repeat protein
MSKQTDKSLFILSSMPRLYQHLLTGGAGYEALGKRIIDRVKLAQDFRHIELVKELARVLINISIKEYKLIAEYYLVWCKCRDLECNTDTLEKIIEQTQTYKTKALFSRGAVEWYKGRNEIALYFYKEALKTYPTISEYIDLSRTIAVLKATEGFHKSALRDLENLLPVIRYAEPRLYYDFLNSYGVELAEAGRIEEASRASQIALASPFAPYYAEWLETGEAIRIRVYRSRSVVSVVGRQAESDPANNNNASDKVLRPDWSVQCPIITYDQPAQIKHLADSEKFRMNKKNTKQESSVEDYAHEDYAHLEKRAELHRIIANPDTTGEQLDELLRHYEQMKSKPIDQK